MTEEVDNAYVMPDITLAQRFGLVALYGECKSCNGPLTMRFRRHIHTDEEHRILFCIDCLKEVT
jgi:hypothetical protein